MQTQPAFGFPRLLTHLVSDIAKAVCERGGEAPQRQFDRSEAAVHMVMGFLPRDVIEAMLAGHCVMFHSAMTDCVPETLRGEPDATRRGARSHLLGLNRAFTGNLDRLRQYRARPAEGNREAVATEVRPAVTPAESAEPVVPPMNRAATRAARKLAARALRRTGRTPVAAAPVPASRDIPASPRAVVEGPVACWFSPSDLAAMHDNPAAMAAIAARDPVAFAHSYGITNPSAEFLAAAAEPGSPFAPDVAEPTAAEPGSDTTEE
jgi:hypothetical protein